MPRLPELFDAYPFNMTLDGTGSATVSFQPNGSNISISRLYVQVSTSVKQASVTLYKGNIAPSNAIGTIVSGSTGGLASGQIFMSDGQTLYVVWTGGDAGATATVTFSGKQVPFNEMGNDSITWSDPIAASDGSLIFPAIRSPNYIPGTMGWNLDRNGNADLNTVTVRGVVDITGTDGSNVHISAGGGTALLTIKPPDYSGFTPLPFSNPATISGDIFNSANVGKSQLVITGPYPDIRGTPIITLASQSIDGTTSQDSINISATNTIFSGPINDGNRAVYSPGYNGKVNVSFTALTSFTVAVVFPHVTNGTPHVFTNIDDGSGPTAQWHSRAINITASGFTLFVFATAASTWSNIPVSWAAFIPS